MDFIVNLPLFTIIIGFIGVVLTSFLNRKVSKIIALIVEATAIVFGILVTVYTFQNGYVEYQLGHLKAPFCNQIRFGPYEGLLATLVPTVMLLSVLAGSSHAHRDIAENKEHSLYTLLNLILVAIVAIIYTDDVFTGYVFLEISTLSSVGLTMIKNHGRQIAAALRYMLFNLLGSGLFLLGCIFLYGETGYLSMTSIQQVVTTMFAEGKNVLALTISFTLISVGLGIKSGLFPFYYWMGDTYGVNTTTASSVLSGLISKGYIILLIKMIYRTFGIENVMQTSLLHILFVLGACGMIFGSITAIRQRVINKMVSYSSAAQIGYIYLGIGLGPAGLVAATFHLFTHALCKPLLFSTSNRLIDASRQKAEIRESERDGVRRPSRRNRLYDRRVVDGRLSVFRRFHLQVSVRRGFDWKRRREYGFVQGGRHHFRIGRIDASEYDLLSSDGHYHLFAGGQSCGISSKPVRPSVCDFQRDLRDSDRRFGRISRRNHRDYRKGNRFVGVGGVYAGTVFDSDRLLYLVRSLFRLL